MNIDQKVLMTPEICNMTRDGLFNLREYWIDRGEFYTLGASVYIDPPVSYPGIAANTNIVLDTNFSWLKALVANYFKEIYNREIICMKDKALPGFHIFTSEANDLVGSIHTDEVEDRVEWACGYTDAFSFTIPISLPAAGGGMNYWDKGIINVTNSDKPKYLPYELGVIYIYDGKSPHQIANNELLGETDFRITYQGHGVTLDTGKIAIYF